MSRRTGEGIVEESPHLSPQYRFGDYLLDVGAGWLRQQEREIELPPRVFQVLVYLVENRERIVPKQELIQEVWKETFVTDDALVQSITAIRKALGDEAGHPRYIRTKPRVGYQFIAPLTDTDADSEAAAAGEPIRRGTGRILFLLIQAGYLGLYSLALVHLEEAGDILGNTIEHLGLPSTVAFPGVVFLALSGVAVRLYLIAAVGFDHPLTGRRFRQLFPALFLLDVIWALAPLLVAHAYGWLWLLAAVPVLAYSPFSQRTLIRSAYPA